MQQTHRNLFQWIITTVALIAAAAVAWWHIASTNSRPLLRANITEPTTAEFTDNANMFFATARSIPDVNNDRKLTAPADITISYNSESDEYSPAFIMNLSDDALAKNITISPFIRGTWRTNGDSAISFTPDANWPAGEKFTIKINQDIFNPDIRPNTRRITFETPDITTQIDNFNLYDAPNAPQSVVGVAVISFNYAIDVDDFNNNISMELDNDDLDFSVKFDSFYRTALIISEPVKITDEPQIMQINIGRIHAADGKSKTKSTDAKITIESADNIFKISSLDTIVADDNDGNAQQLILLNTTVAADNNTKWTDYVHAYLLPQYRDADEQKSGRMHIWSNDEISDSVLSQSQRLDISQMDFANPGGVYQYAFKYIVPDGQTRYIYVSVDNGAKSANGFIMKNGASYVMRVPYPNQSVKIIGTGALLSLSGDQQIGIAARGGVNTAYVNLYKVKSDEINHLISQTYDIFAPNIAFKSWAFGTYDMSVVFQKRIAFANSSVMRTNYSSINLGEYLDRTGNDKTGIFIIQTGTTANAAEFNDQRLILLTDMGIIRKQNMDESSSVFVSNLSTGKPAADIDVYVLGRNGNPVWSGRTNADGRVDIPQLDWSEYRNTREPVAIVARRGNDVSFIPYNAYAQRVEYSKYDIDGVYSAATNPLNAFMFSDRGIYRPGEEIIFGGIVKNNSFSSLSGIPVKLIVNDARGRTVMEHAFSLTSDGMFDIREEISDGAALGTWFAYLYSLNANNDMDNMLGMTSFDVQEFTPDTMKITAKITDAQSNGGWISTDNITAAVSLRNLFGTPATERRITTHATLTPSEYSFDDFAGYKFTTNFIHGTGLSDNTIRRTQTFAADMPDAITNENGNANINIDFNRDIPYGTYTLTLNINGFESGSGKSVQTNIATRVSNVPYVVGWRATGGDLSYIKTNTPQKIHLIALGSDATQIDVKNLTMQLMRRENTTTLVKDYNNYYKYQTTTRDKLISQSDISIPVDGTDINLDTSSGGNYILQIIDSNNNILANIEYFVVGGKNKITDTDATAELQIKLNATKYKPGAEIEIGITAPYTGTGLITLERDKVYAYKWFNTDSTSTVQHITLPDGFSGNGYVNVSFVRNINSRDIFTTPYAYAVAPFETDNAAHEIDIQLDVPDVIRDNKLDIKYTTNKSSKIMIFAVNSGILQVAKYQIPNPIRHFFQKAALQVNTFQTLSLLLPEYNIWREMAKTGGGDYGAGNDGLNQILTNPFGRRDVKSVAFYSGIINATANVPGTVEFEIPQHFDGAIQVFAVAANDSSVGSADTETLVQSPVIISVSAPNAVAPDDEFDINAVITNMTKSGKSANAYVNVSTVGGLEISGTTNTDSDIPENAEELFTFSAHATDNIGNSEISINAKMTGSDNNILATRTATTNISVRPATTFETHVISDALDSKSKKIKNFNIDMYPEYSTRNIYISTDASALIMPLFAYLEKYEYPCTEQTISRAMPYVLMPDNKLLGTTFDESATQVANAINILKNRQNPDGSFALWATTNSFNPNNNNTANDAYLTAYAVQFLKIAHDAGFNVPTQMLSRGIDYLRTYAGESISNPADATSVAYAIYVITANDYVSTSYIDLFTEYADKNIKNWKSGILGSYIAASYKLMHQDDLAKDLINKYRPSDKNIGATIFNNHVSDDAMYYYLMNAHFGGASAINSDIIREYISSGTYSAYTSATAIMALAGGKSNASIDSIKINIDGHDIQTTQYGTSIAASIPAGAKTLEIQCPECKNNGAQLFYTIVQQGYPTESDAHSNGIEIIREYYDANGTRITSGELGDSVFVKISVRTRGDTDNANIVITDLMPGGFIPDPESATGDMEFIEMRDDRVLIYTDITRTERVFTYTAQLGTVGKFTIPAIHAESMYNPEINATGKTGTFTVSNED